MSAVSSVHNIFDLKKKHDIQFIFDAVSTIHISTISTNNILKQLQSFLIVNDTTLNFLGTFCITFLKRSL